MWPQSAQGYGPARGQPLGGLNRRVVRNTSRTLLQMETASRAAGLSAHSPGGSTPSGSADRLLMSTAAHLCWWRGTSYRPTGLFFPKVYPSCRNSRHPS